VNVESKRLLACAASYFEDCSIGDDLADAGMRIGLLTALVRIHGDGAASGSLDVQTIDANEREVSGTEEQIGVAGFDMKTLSGGERREFSVARAALKNDVLGHAAGKREEGTAKMLNGYGAVKGLL